MAITGNFDLRPFGYGNEPVRLVDFCIHSSDDNSAHLYSIKFGSTQLNGSVPKSKSGHGNILHLIADILADTDLDGLPLDYTSVRKRGF